MAILKTIAIFFVGLLFYLALSSAIGVGIVSKITEYDSMKSVFVDFLEAQLNKTPNIDVMGTALTKECASKDSIVLPLQGQNITVDCKEYLKTKSVTKTLAGSMFDSIYYKKYDCDFVECLKQGNLTVLLSSAASSFIQTIFSSALLATIAIGILFSLLIRKVANILKNIGGCLLATALPFLLISNIKSFLPAQMSVALPLVEKLTSSLSIYMFAMLGAGVVLIVAGFVLGRKK